MTMPLRAVLAVALSLSSAAAMAAEPKSFRIATKVGRSNVAITVVLHPQVDDCSAALLLEIRRKAEKEGQAFVRDHLAGLIKKSGTDASDDKQFFGVGYLAGCPKGGAAWIAFPLEGKDKSVSSFSPGAGWSPMIRL